MMVVIVRNEVLPDNCLGIYLKYFDNSDSNNVIEIVGFVPRGAKIYFWNIINFWWRYIMFC